MKSGNSIAWGFIDFKCIDYEQAGKIISKNRREKFMFCKFMYFCWEIHSKYLNCFKNGKEVSSLVRLKNIIIFIQPAGWSESHSLPYEEYKIFPTPPPVLFHGPSVKMTVFWVWIRIIDGFDWSVICGMNVLARNFTLNCHLWKIFW